MTWSPDSLAAVRAAPILEVAADTLQLHKSGRQFIGVCPFHGDKDPSLSIDPDKNVFYCFGCGAGGDVVAFTMKRDGLSFPVAVRYLSDRFSIPLTGDDTQALSGPEAYEIKRPRGRGVNGPMGQVKETQSAPINPLWSKKATAFVLDRHALLLASKKALKHLEKTRGITKETARRFYLGMNPEDFWRHRSAWGLPDVAGRDGKVYRNFKIDRGLVIPSVSGDPVAASRIRIRRPEGEPKYKVIPGSDMAPLTISSPDPHAVTVVVESELCAILLSQELGAAVSVVAMGSAQARPSGPSAALLASASVILNALDFDAAGAAALRAWRERHPNMIRWPVPEGKDPTDAFLAGVDLSAWIFAGIPGAAASGASLLMNKNGRRGRTTQTCEAATAPEPDPPPLPAGVLRLAEILRASPVAIVSSESRVTIKEPRGWAASHWHLSKELSDLVYFNDAVFDWICRHPAGVITGGNVLVGI